MTAPTHYQVKTFVLSGIFVREVWELVPVIGWRNNGDPVVRMKDGTPRRLDARNSDACRPV